MYLSTSADRLLTANEVWQEEHKELWREIRGGGKNLHSGWTYEQVLTWIAGKGIGISPQSATSVAYIPTDYRVIECTADDLQDALDDAIGRAIRRIRLVMLLS